MSSLGLQQGLSGSTSVLFSHYFPLLVVGRVRFKDKVRTSFLDGNFVPGSTKLHKVVFTNTLFKTVSNLVKHI